MVPPCRLRLVLVRLEAALLNAAGSGAGGRARERATRILLTANQLVPETGR